MMADAHDLSGAYVLDALDAAERTRYEEHLETCDDCRAEVAELRESAAALAEGSAIRPPHRLKAAVMQSIEESPQTAKVTPIRRPRNFRIASFAVAAAVAVLLATVAILQVGGDPDVSDVLAAPDAIELDIVGEGFTARFTYSTSLEAGVLESDSLPAVGPGETYELWLIEDQASPAGLFRPDSSGTSVALVASVRPGLVLGLTIEPAGGSEQPTGEILFTAAIT